jgi:hypothetical protein
LQYHGLPCYYLFCHVAQCNNLFRHKVNF